MKVNSLFSFYLISVTGGSASGKTLFLSKLQEKFDHKITIISQDDYYKPIEYQYKDERGIYNFDLPEAIDHDLFLTHLKRLSKGETIQKEEYTFNHPHKIPAQKIFQYNPVVVIEGLFVTYHPLLKANIDYKIFIDADLKICFERRKQRDLYERGIPEKVFLHQWNHHVVPAYKKYVVKYRDEADLIINNDVDLTAGLEKIIQLINLKIS